MEETADMRMSEEDYAALQDNGQPDHRDAVRARQTMINKNGKGNNLAQLTRLYTKYEAIDCANASTKSFAQLKTIVETLATITDSYDMFKAEWRKTMDVNVHGEDYIQEELAKEQGYELKIAEMRNMYDQMGQDVRHRQNLDQTRADKEVHTMTPIRPSAMSSPLRDGDDDFDDNNDMSSYRRKDKYVQKLKPLPMPEFHGEYTQWPAFFDRFQGLITNNNDLNGIMKLDYLKSCLKGEPLRMITNVPSKNANFEIAMKLLEDRYMDEWPIVAKHMDALFIFKTLTGKNAKELRRLHEVFTVNLQCLINLEEPMDDKVVVHLMASKLDQESREFWESEVNHWKRNSNTGKRVKPTPDNLFEFIEGRARTLEHSNVKAGFGAGQPAKKAVGAGVNALGDSPSPEMQALVHMGDKMGQLVDQMATANFGYGKNVPSGSNPPHEGDKRSQKPKWPGKPGFSSAGGAANKCLHCKEGHKIWSCVAFKNDTLPARKKTVYDNKLCRNCLNSGHVAASCKSNYTCKVCKRKHHSFLHDDEEKQ